MPFESETQRRFMFAQHPRIAKRWAKETPKGKDLPEKKTDSDPEETQDKAEAEKKAAVRLLGINLGLVKNANESTTKKLLAEDILAPGFTALPGLGALHASNAGRATALAKAIGKKNEEISSAVTNPVLTDFLSTLPGAAVTMKAPALGIPLSLASLGLKRLYGQKQINKIADEFNKSDLVGMPSKEDIATSQLWNLITPLGGFHRKGEADTLAHLFNGKNKPSYNFLDYVGAIPFVNNIPGLVNGAIGVAKND